LHRNKQGTTALDDRFATSAEIEGVFDVEREDLGWIAYAISGNKQPAEESLVDAKKTAAYWDWCLRDWLVHWAESATARVAATNTGESLREAAKNYADWSCDHPVHDIPAKNHHSWRNWARKRSSMHSTRSLGPFCFGACDPLRFPIAPFF
jgi:hypothetical protein